MYACMHSYVYVEIHMYIYIDICIYFYIYVYELHRVPGRLQTFGNDACVKAWNNLASPCPAPVTFRILLALWRWARISGRSDPVA